MTLLSWQDYVAPELLERAEISAVKQLYEDVSRTASFAHVELGDDLALDEERLDLVATGRGVKLAEFQGGTYLSIHGKVTDRYNLQRMDRYDVGVRLFDSVVGNLIKVAHEHMTILADLSGCEVAVLAILTDFGDSGVSPEVLWFRFIVPADAAEAYVNHELTGQALLDRSIVLVNDSRIELRLQ